MKKILIAILFIASAKIAEAQWVLQYQTVHPSIVEVASAPDDNNFWFITNFDTLYKTSNGGATWNTAGNPSFLPSGLFVVNKDTAFKSGINMLYRTTNGGNSWSTVFSGSGGTPPVVWMQSNTLGVMTAGGILYESTNGGASWSSSIITQPPAAIVGSGGKGIIYSKGADLWAIISGNKIAYSSNFGVSWSVAPNTGLTLSPVRIFFGSPQFGIVVATPYIYVTTDGTNSWHVSDNSLGSNEDAAINNSHCWYIPDPADHFYIKYSTDSGSTWTQQLSGDGYYILEKSRSGNTLWAGTATGKIYKYWDLNGIQNLQTGIPESYSLSQNYPNPFNPSTKIRFSASLAGEVRLIIYDISGKEIVSLVNQDLRPGNYEVEWNASNYSSGVYFYKITAGDFTEIKKMVLVK